MFVSNFKDSEDKYIQFTVEILKAKEFGSTKHFASFQKYFEYKQINYVTKFQDSEDKCIQFTVEILKSIEFGSTT